MAGDCLTYHQLRSMAARNGLLAAFDAANGPPPATATKAVPSAPVGAVRIVSLTMWFPIIVVSEANQRVHWTTRYRRFKHQAVTLRSMVAGIKLPALPVCITLTRHDARLLDTDNLGGAFKSVRDELARIYGVDDAPDGKITWAYAQVKNTKAKGISVWFEAAENLR